MRCKVNIGKVALLLCNFIFLLSGFCLILLGCILLNDAPRILLSHLAYEPGTIPEPLLYYVALGFVAAGMIVSSVALLGCWTSLGPESNCLMAFYIFLLVVLLLVEISTGVVGSLCPQAVGAGMDRDQMVTNLMNNYGVPGRDKYTAAVDLAQTVFECCGMQSGSDFDGSRWWKREQDSKHELRVPRSCCFLENTNFENAFLDPIPVNLTLCQAKNNARYQLGRHVKGCIDQLNIWFKEHITIFLIIGLALVVVQLSVLLCAIIVCLRRKKRDSLLPELDGSRETSSSSSSSKRKNPGSESDFKSNAAGKDSNGGNCRGNGLTPSTPGRCGDSGKRINSNGANYSFKNLNYTDTESCIESAVCRSFFPRNENFHRFDGNGNNPQGPVNWQDGGKYQQETDGDRNKPCYTAPMYLPQSPIVCNNYQHEAVRNYLRKSNDSYSANNDRCLNELGT